MTEVEITKMSSKGQIVIPQDIREDMGLKDGETFAVTGGGDTLLLKKIERPSREKIISDWERITAKARKEVKKLGIKQRDVSKLIHKGRGIKE